MPSKKSSKKKSGTKETQPAKAPESAPAAEVIVAETSSALRSDSGMSEVSTLQTENSALKAELAALKAQLESKDGEISELKSKVNAAPQSAGALKGTGDMTALQERLSQLKVDQQEADAARDMAWSELKRCVQEVAKLANAEMKDTQSMPST